MNTAYPDAELGSIATLWDCLHKTPSYSEDGYPMVRVTDIKRGFLDLSGTLKVHDQTYQEFIRRYKPRAGDILLTRVGSYGNSCYVDRDQDFCLGQNTVCIAPDRRKIIPYFLYCCLNTPSVKQQIDSFVGGASQPTISLRNISLLRIPLSDIAVQRKIATILSAYDDLIENNLRRIKILEEMAQNLYREWFVKFRFPGHQRARFTDSPLGRIPEGWEVAKIKDVADVNTRSVRKEGGPAEIAYIDIASVSPGSINKMELMAFSDAPSRARRLTRHGDIIWSSVRPNRRSFSLIIDPPVNLVVSTGFAVISAKKVPFTYLYQATTTDDFVVYLVNHAKGAAYPAVSAEDFENADILVPSKQLLSSFDDKVLPIAILTHRLKAINTTLRRTRDLLLPRLISGEVDVSELDIDIKESAA